MAWTIIEVPGWGIMRYMGVVEIGVVVLFIIAVALAVWWAVVSLRRR